MSPSRPTPPPVLYHYTNAAGLKGIVDGVGSSSFPQVYKRWGFSRAIKLLASDVRYMNDRDELRAAGRVFADIIDQHVDAENQQDVGGTQILVELARELRQNGYLPDPAQVFAACFSTEPDDLSQWRGYAGGTGGFAIGIPSAALFPFTYPMFAFTEPLSPNLPPTAELIKVSYDLADVGPAADDFVRRYIDGPGRSPNDLQLARFDLAALLPRYKGPGFKSENEWRAIAHFAPPAEDSVARIGELRVARFGLTPYTSFGVNVDAGFDDQRGVRPARTIERLVVGPGPHQNLQITAAKQLLAINGHEPSVVEASQVTFRD